MVTEMQAGRFRLSLKWLLGLATLLAVAICLLVNASHGVWIAVRTASWALLLLSLLGSVAASGKLQRFCMGFAVIAWGNLLFYNPISWYAFASGEYTTDGVHYLLVKFWEAIRVEVELSSNDDPFGPTTGFAPEQYTVWDTGIHLMSAILGFIGGSIAAAAYRRPISDSSPQEL